MSVPPSPSHACHCINPHCSQPSQHWAHIHCRSCGTSLRLKDRYVPLQRLQVGDDCHLYQVYDLEAGVEQVMRVLIRTTPKAQEKFRREAVALASLHHRGLPKVEMGSYFHVAINQPQEYMLPCLVMEKIDGQSLQALTHRYPQGCPEAWVVNWLGQAVGILQKLHSRQIFHGDLQPASFVLRPGGHQLAIADLGFPHQLMPNHSETTQPLTSGYSPPEQLRGRALDTTTDFYALGRICLHWLTGCHPLALEDASSGEMRWRSRVQVNSMLADLLDRMVQRDVRLRPTTATEILEVLTNISFKPAPPKLNSRPTPPPPPPSPPNSPTRSRHAAVKPGVRPNLPSRSGGHLPSSGGSPVRATPVRSVGTKPRGIPHAGSKSGSNYSRNGMSSSGGGVRTKAPPATITAGRYREDPYPQAQLTSRLDQSRQQSQTVNLFTTMEQAWNWVVQISLVIFRAIFLAAFGSSLASAIGFWLTYWSPLSGQIHALFAHQLVSSAMPLSVTPAMIVFAFAGVGTTWGLTQTGKADMEGHLWQMRAMGGVTYAIAWIGWQLGATRTTLEQAIALLGAIIALGMVLNIGARSNRIIQAMVTIPGTSMTLVSLMQLTWWQPGAFLNLFRAMHTFTPDEPTLWATLVAFSLLGMVFSFWIGVSYYIGLPLLEQIRTVGQGQRRF